MGKQGQRMQGQVLALLEAQQRPLSAYDILAQLCSEQPRLAPPTVYRALNALLDQGRIHRLESLNAFVACRCAKHDEAAIMSICDACGIVEERLACEVTRPISGTAALSGFQPSRQVIEVHGYCAACRGNPMD